MIGEPNKANTINKAPVTPPPPTPHNQLRVNLPITPSSTHTKIIHLGYILMRLLKALGYFFLVFPTPLPFPERFVRFCSWLLQYFTKGLSGSSSATGKAALATSHVAGATGTRQIMSFCNSPRSTASAMFPCRQNAAGTAVPWREGAGNPLPPSKRHPKKRGN